MAEFCSCGSLIINESCTNKNCSFKTTTKKVVKKTKTVKAAAASSLEPKKKVVRRSSKCITYPISELETQTTDK